MGKLNSDTVGLEVLSFLDTDKGADAGIEPGKILPEAV